MRGDFPQPVLSFVGHSNSGKTTVLVRLVAELERRGYRVAVIKHHRGGDAEMDLPGKDTWRLARAGADQVLLVTPREVFHRRRTEREPDLEEVVRRIEGVDLVLTEGYKDGPALKVEVTRGDPLVSRPNDLVAIVTDRPHNLDVPQFEPGDAKGLADLIEDLFLRTREV